MSEVRLVELRPRDWIAVSIAAPLLGWGLMVGELGLSADGTLDRPAIRAGLLRGHGWFPLLGGLVVIAIVLGLLSPRLRGFAGSTVMSLVILFVIDDYWIRGASNIVAGVIALYLILTGFTIFVGWAFTDILRFAHERRGGGKTQSSL